jgi:hypothetical protein
MTFYLNPDGGEAIYFPRHVGDVLDNPPEPPVGTTLLCTDKDMPVASPDRNFRMRRDDHGWYQTSSPKGARIGWETVCKLWLPASIVGLPPTIEAIEAADGRGRP